MEDIDKSVFEISSDAGACARTELFARPGNPEDGSYHPSNIFRSPFPRHVNRGKVSWYYVTAISIPPKHIDSENGIVTFSFKKKMAERCSPDMLLDASLSIPPSSSKLQKNFSIGGVTIQSFETKEEHQALCNHLKYYDGGDGISNFDWPIFNHKFNPSGISFADFEDHDEFLFEYEIQKNQQKSENLKLICEIGFVSSLETNLCGSVFAIKKLVPLEPLITASYITFRIYSSKENTSAKSIALNVKVPKDEYMVGFACRSFNEPVDDAEIELKINDSVVILPKISAKWTRERTEKRRKRPLPEWLPPSLSSASPYFFFSWNTAANGDAPIPPPGIISKGSVIFNIEDSSYRLDTVEAYVITMRFALPE